VPTITDEQLERAINNAQSYRDYVDDLISSYPEEDYTNAVNFADKELKALVAERDKTKFKATKREDLPRKGQGSRD
jgi:hypothetical protein